MQVPEAARELWPDVVSLMRGLAGAGPGEVPAQVHAVRTVYAPLLERRYDNVDARLRDIEQIESLASRAQDRSRFLADLALDPPSYTQDLAGPPVLDEDYVILSTMHSAKGLEFDCVYVIHAADGNIPSDMATGSPRRSKRNAASSTSRARGEEPPLREPPAALLHATVGQVRYAWLRPAQSLPHRGCTAAFRRVPGIARHTRRGRRTGPADHKREHPRRRAGLWS